jgi:hypothetical protein
MLTSPEARKFQVALLCFLLSAATGGLLPPDIAIWVIVGINALTAAGVFVIPNTNLPVLAKPAVPPAPDTPVSSPEGVTVVEAPAVVVEPFDKGDVRG